MLPEIRNQEHLFSIPKFTVSSDDVKDFTNELITTLLDENLDILLDYLTDETDRSFKFVSFTPITSSESYILKLLILNE